MRGSMPWRRILTKYLSTMAALMIWLKPSSMMIKRKGDRGSPCLILQEGEKGWEGTPLIKIENNAKDARLRI
jgi:hypothetical protein